MGLKDYIFIYEEQWGECQWQIIRPEMIYLGRNCTTFGSMHYLKCWLLKKISLLSAFPPAPLFTMPQLWFCLTSLGMQGESSLDSFTQKFFAGPGHTSSLQLLVLSSVFSMYLACIYVHVWGYGHTLNKTTHPQQRLFHMFTNKFYILMIHLALTMEQTK